MMSNFFQAFSHFHLIAQRLITMYVSSMKENGSKLIKETFKTTHKEQGVYVCMYNNLHFSSVSCVAQLDFF